jgi:spermidine synthase
VIASHPIETGGPSSHQRFLPLLLLLFAGSGCSALIYEIVWFQLLQFVIGSTAVSLGVLLGTFMGGMCLGSLALPRLVSPRFHPLFVYAMLEMGLGFFGIAVLFALPHVDHFYAQFVSDGFLAVLSRGAVCAVCLLPPTVLMGATLPAVARWIETTPQGMSWLGLFYGGNIGGAVFGCLLAGFYLLRVYDLATATYVAAMLNGAVGLAGIALAALTPHAPVPALKAASRVGGSWAVYLAIGLSGACALAAEVIWTRLLSLMLGATVYTFSIILAVFLVGLGIGSAIGSMLARRPHPRISLCLCQLLLTGAIAWTAFMVATSMPFWPITPYPVEKSPWLLFQLDLARCLWAILPATVLWGASFPLALASAAGPGQDPGRLVGGVYAANTVGAIVGAIVSTLVLIPLLGTQHSQRILIGISALAALLVLMTYFFSIRIGAASPRRSENVLLSVAYVSLLSAAIGAPAALLVWFVPAIPWQLVAYGRYVPTTDTSRDTCLFMGEGMNSSVAVSKTGTDVRIFHVSGKAEASSNPQDMRVQRMLGHFPALFHPNPRSVLVVGCGAGVTAGSFLVHPAIERIVICEIEPLVPQQVAPHFAKENNDVINDKRVTIVYDDARHYVLTTHEKFDIITSDPIHPWVKGSASLYTTEYFEMCKRHLNPGGVITQWVPLYESDLYVVQSQIATFFHVFPQGTIWSNSNEGRGYDTILLDREGGLQIDADDLEERLKRADHADVRKSLAEVNLATFMTLLSTFGGTARDLRPWFERAEINRDRNLRLQYLAGMALNKDECNPIHSAMMSYRRVPEDIFVGSGSAAQTVRFALKNVDLVPP